MWNINMNKKMKICFSAGIKYNGIYYLSAIHMNALFMYDEKKDKLTFLTSFEKENKSEYLFLKAFLYKNEAWFIPYQAEYIAIVNLDTFVINYIPLRYRKECDNKGKYINILYFNEKYLCLIPWTIDTVVIIDLQNKTTMAYYDIGNQRKSYQSAIFFDNKIYFFPWNAKDILVLDLITNEQMKLHLTEREENFGEVIYDKKTEHLFHAPAKQNYILIDSLKDKTCKKIGLDFENDGNYKTFYASEKRDDIFFWGHEKNIVLKMNKNDNKVKIYPIILDSTKKNLFPICSEDIEALIYNDNCIVRYNIKKDKFSYLYINIVFEELMQAIKSQEKKFIKKEKVYFGSENETQSLIFFLYYMLCDARDKENKIKENIGSQIYNNI